MTLRRPLSRPARRPQTRFALEPRIVFDGAVAVAANTTAEHHDAAPPAPHVAAIERNTHPQADTVRVESDVTSPAGRDAHQGARAIGQRVPADRDMENIAVADPHQIAFVDASVADIEAYLPGFKGQVVTLKSDQDGVAQIAQALAGRTDLTAIHILSHGEAGLLLLGNGSLDTAGITGAHAADIAAIKNALAPGGDLLLYGCDVAAGASGQEFIEALATATNADVAASTDDTGAADRGGNWTLEAHVGTIETKSIDASGWEGLLAQTSTDVWTVSGNGNGTTAASTVGGVTTTVSFGSFSTLTTNVAAFNTTGAGATLNNIPVFTPAVQNTADLGFTFNWDTAVVGGGGAEAGLTGGTAVITITFSSAVTNPIIHLDRIGGQANGFQNGMRFTLVNPGGLSLTALSGTPHFAVDTVNGTIQNSQIDQATGNGYTTESSQSPTLGTAAGSVQVNGTVTSVSFTMSAAPNSNQGTGGDAVELKVTFDPTPVAVNDSFTTSHDKPIVLNVRSNDSDPQGDAINVTKVNGAAITKGGASVAVTNGSVALNAAGNLVFTPTAGFVGSTSFTYAIADANGGEATATVTGSITNSAPVANNDTFTTNEDTAITVDPRANDTDVDGDALTIKQVNGTNIAVGGNGIDVTGGVVTINAAGTLVFTPTANDNGSTSFTYTVSDPLGLTSTATINGTVTPVDDAPVVNLNSNTNLLIDGDFENTQQAALNQNNLVGTTYGAFTTTAQSINVIHVNGTTYAPGPDNAAANTNTGAQAEANSDQYIDLQGDGTLSQNFTLGTAQTIAFGGAFSNRDLSQGTYTPPATQIDILDAGGTVVASATALSLTRANGAESWFTTSGTASLAAGTYTYRVTLGNFGHVDSVYVRVTPNYATSYTENAAPISIANANDAVTDVDNANITSATIVLTNPVAGDYLSVIAALPSGITASAYDTTAHTITLSGSATKAAYATAIADVGFASTSDDPTNANRTINVTVSDGTLSSNTAVTTITVIPVNDAPTSVAPTSVSGAEDSTFAFTAASKLTVADPDSPNLTVTLNVGKGTLTLGTTTGLTFTNGNGTANASMTFSGTQAQLNTALASLTFRPNADYNGSDTLNFTTSDGLLSTAKTVALTVTPVADITADSLTVNRNGTISFDAILGTNGATADTFSDPGRAITSVTQPTNGTVTFTAAGVITYTPNTNYSGTDTFTYTVTAGGVTETATETITVLPNQAPTSVAPASATATEDTTFAFSGANKLSVADVDSANLTVTLNVGKGTLTLGTTTGLTFTTGNGTGNTSMTFSGTQAQLNAALASLSYRGNPDYNGSDTLNFTTSDGSLNTAKTVALTVTPVADITADSVTTNENTAISFNAITGTNGATADTFSDPARAVTAVTQGAHGSVSFTAAGVLTYTPNANYSGTDTFTYTVTSGGVTETATETVTINFVNQAPTSTAPASATTAEDTSLAFSGANKLTVADVDSPNLTVTLNVGHGTLTLGTTTGLTFTTGNGTANASMTFSGTQAQLNAALASLSYRGNPDYNGSDTLNFTTSDGSLNTAKTVALTVTPVADITADSVTTAENAAISFNAITGTNGATPDTFSDPTRAVTAVTQGAHGTVSYTAAGVLTYTPNANYSGSDTFTYTVTSGGTTETATETVTVNFVNQAPTSVAPASATSPEDTTLNFTGGNALSVADVDSANLTVTLNVGKGTLTLGTTTGLTFTTGNGTGNTSMTFSGTQAQLNAALASLSYRANADYNGSDTLGFSTSDGSLTTNKSVALTITPVADITADSVTTNENTAISFNAITGTNGATADTFSDPARAVAAVTQGAHGSVSFTAAGVLTYTPNANYSGTDTFTYTVTSGGVTETATETVTVNFVNQAPTSTAPASATTAEDTSLAFSGANKLTVADVDSPNLTVTLNVGHGTLTLGTTTGLTFTTGNGSANATMTFSGTQVQLNNALASLSYRGNPDYNGSDTLNFTTSDGSLNTAKTVALTVTPVADITADSVTTNENTAISFNAITGTNGATADTFSDPTRAVTSVTQGAHGSVSFTAAGVLTYTPNANYSGTDTFTYTVTSGGVTETATETVTVSFVNQAPSSTAPVAATTNEDTTLAFTGGNGLSVTDVDSANLTVTLNVGKGTLTLGTTTGLTFTSGTGTANASMTFSGTQAQLNAALASLSYRANADYNGSDTLGFSTSDGSLTTSKSVALTIAPVADITADSVTTNENVAISFNAITGTNGATADTFSDPARAVTSVTQGAHGSVSFTAAGVLTYTPNANYSGTDTFTYTVTSGGVTETATETVTINFVNQAPTSTAPASATTAEDTSFAFSGANKLTVADVDSPNLTVTLNVGKGTLTLGTTTGLTFTTGNGTANASMTFSGTQVQLNAALASLSYRGNPDYNGSDTLNFTTSDGSLNTAKTVALTVTPVADITADSVTTAENTVIVFNAITGTNGATADTFSDPSRAVTAVTQGAHGSVSYNADGTLTYTPNANFSGTDTFTYTVTAGGTTETATETVNISFVNQAPTSSAPASITSPEDTPLAFTGANKLTVADVDSPNLTVSLIVTRGTLTLGTTTGLTFTTGSGTASASMTFSGTQAQLNAALASLTFRPSADYNGNTGLSFTVSDGSLSNAKSVGLLISPVADITADSVTTNENTAIAFNAITGTNGATADTFSDPTRAVTAVTQGAHGTVAYNANGTLTYTPNANYSGTDTFNYTVTAGGSTETATETVTINFVNQAPTSTAPAAVTTNEDTTLAFTGGNALSVADVDSANLTVTLNVGKGTLTLGTTTGLTFTTGNGTANTSMTFSGTQAQVNSALASLTFRPNADYNGGDTLNFTTSDGSLSTAKAIALTVTPVADITADNVTTAQNVAVSFNAITGTNGATADTFSDPTRAVTSVTQGAHGTVTFTAAGVLTYTPNTNYNGNDTFTYTVTSGGTNETATETVTIGAVNQAPTSTAPTAVTSSEDTTLAFTGGNALTVADIDSPNLTVALNVGHGTLTLGTTTGLTFTTGNGTANPTMTFSGTQAQLNVALASLSFRPNADYNGSDILGFSTSDGSLTATKSVSLTITPVADITADSVATNENTAISFNAITGTNGATADTFSDPTRAVTSVTQGAHGTVSYTAAGVLTYTPTVNYSGSDTFTYTVTSGGVTETATETVTVNFVNQAPTSTAPASVTFPEDTTRGFRNANTLSVSDVDNSILTVSLNVGHGLLTLSTTTGLTFTTGNGSGSAAMTFSGTQADLNNALASIAYKGNPDFNGTDTLDFTTSDGSLSTAKSTTITVTPVADITADSVNTNQNAAISFNAITGTNGATADTFSDPTRAVTSVTQGAHGTVGFNADGTLTYMPNTNYSGTDTFTYTVTAGGTTETATETVTIGAVNQAPTSMAPTSVTSAEDTAVNFTGGNALSVADVDSPTLTVTLNVGHGTLTLGTTTGLTFTTGNGAANAAMTFSGTQAQLNTALASLSYRGSPDYNGSDTLNFTTSDGSLNTAKTVALTVTPVADITADSVTTNENTAISFNAITGTNGATADTFSDPTRAVTSVTQGAHGSVSFTAAGVLTYTPNANYSGTDTFTYTVTSGGVTETATETVTVNFVNQAPASSAPTAITSSEDTTLNFNGGNALSVSDVDSPNLTVTLNVGHGTLTLGTTTGLTFTTGNGTANSTMTFSGTEAQLNAALASLSFRPNADYNGSDILGFTTSDGSLTTNKSVALTITPVADITADSVTTNENAAITFNAITGTNGATADTFSDPSRAVTAVTQGAHGTVSYNANGPLTYTPNTNFSGTDTFTYTVTSGGVTETATETVTVSFVNQAPTSTAPTSITSAEDTTFNFTGGNTLSVADVDNPNLTVTLNVGHGTLTLGTTTGLTFTTGNGTANSTMTFSGTQAQLNAALASLSFRPNPDYNGNDALVFTTSDGSLSTAKTVALSVTPVADITADSVTTNENAAITFNAITGTNGATADTFSDPSRAVTSVTQGAHGTVSYNADGTLTYTPNANYSGSDTFTYTVTSGGTTETATETVTVNFVNQAPTSVAPTSVTSAEDTTVAFNGANALTVSDVDSPNLTVTLNVTHGTLTLGTTTGLTFTTGNGTANTAMTFTGTQAQLNTALASLGFRPDPDYNGSATLGFNTSDGALTTAKTVALTITPVADITADSVTTNQNTAISFNAITGTNGATADTFSDPSRAVTSVTQGVHGTVTFTAAGVLTYIPNASFFGSDSYSYTVTAGGTTETAAVTMTVVHVDQAPVANNDSFTIAEDATATIDVRANDTDPDGDPLTVTQVNGQAITAGGPGVAVTGGTITLGSSGNLVYTPTPYYRGSTSFTYTVADPFGATSSATVNGTITPVNHAPDAANDTGTVDEDHNSAGNVLTNDTDPDGDPLTVAAVNGNAASVGTAIAGSNGGLFVIQANGSYSFATNGQFEDLGAGQSRITSVTYTAADGQGGTKDATVTITVTGVNNFPVANPDSYDTTDTSGAPSGLPLTNNVLTNDTDAEHDTLTVSAVNGSAAKVGAPTAGSYGTLTLNANGTFSYSVDRSNLAVLTLLRGQAPLTDQFTYADSDGHGGTNTTTLTIRIQGTSDGPLAGNDSNAIVQGQPVATGNVISGVRTDGSGTTTTVPSAADLDPGHTLNVSEIRLPGDATGTPVTTTSTGSRAGRYGTLTIDANGNYTYALDNASAAVQALVPGQPVTETFVYSVTDGVLSTEATITISIDGRNDPPVAQNDSFTTAEGTAVAINVRANDSDPDHDPIRVTAVNGTPLTAGGAGVAVTGGVVTLNTTGDLVYTPSTYYRGSPSFTYTIEDPSGANATATVSGIVTPVNHAPTAVADTFSTLQNTATTIDVRANDSDVDGDTITVTQVNGNAVVAGGAGVAVNGGVVTLTSAGTLLFTPANNFNGTTSFNYTIADPSGATSTAAVNGNVSHVNQPPTPADDQFTSPQNATATINVRANDSDPDGDALTVTQVNGTAITAGGAAVAVAGGTVILDSAGNLEFTPTGNFKGSTSFYYTVSDPFGATGSATVSGTITAINHPPMASPDTFTVVQGSTATIDARANDTDPDGDPLTITEVNGNAVTAGGPAVAVNGGSVALDASGKLVFTPTPGYVGSASFAYTVADPSGATSSAAISGTVSAAPNHAPVASPDSFSSPANTPATIDVRANDTDADGDPLTVTQINGTAIATGGPGVAVTGGVVTLDASGNVVFTPTANFNGPTSFTYTIKDPSGATSSAAVSGTIVAPGNHAPAAVGDAFTISAGTVAVVDVRANDADVDGDPLTVTQINGTAITAGGPGIAVTGGMVTLDASGNVVFTPNAGFAGTTLFNYTVKDPSGGTSMASVNGTVTRGLHEPVAMPDTVGIPENSGPTIIDVRGNDVDVNNDPLTITQIDGMAITAGGPGVTVAGGVVTLDSGGNLVFTPTANTNGPAGFTYTISDPSGSRSTAAVSIAVTPSAGAPTAVADTFSVPENAGATALDVRGNDVTVGGNPVTITQVNGAAITANGPAVAVAGGSVTLDSAGNLFFTPTANTNGPVAFTYTISDPNGSQSTAGVSVNVAPGAHAPVAMPDSYTITENSAATVLPVRSNDVDPDGNPLTITQINGQAITAGGPGISVAGGVLNVDVAGRLLFIPNANFNGSVSFAYTISDPFGSVSTAGVRLNVVPLDIGPVARPDSASGKGPVTVDVLANDTDSSGTIDRTSVQLVGTANPGDPLTVAGKGTFTINPVTGAITFTPAAGFVGTTIASYTVADNHGLRSAPAPLSVTSTNHAPVANPDTFSVAANTVATINVLANDSDADGDALTITQINGQPIAVNGPPVVTSAGSFTLGSDGNLRFTPVPNYNGPASFTYTVRDPFGATSTTSVTGTVVAPSGAPVAAPDIAYGEPGAPIVIDVLSNDRSFPGDPVRVTAINGQPISSGGPGVAIPGGVVTLNADGTLRFVPNASGAALEETSFSYTITSQSGASSSAVVQLGLDGVTNPPLSNPYGGGAYLPAGSPPAMTPALFVLESVSDTRSEFAVRDPFGTLVIDTATAAEVVLGLHDDLTFAAGDPVGRVGLIGRDTDLIREGVNAHSETLYVQHAVRYETLPDDQALFVQHAVRQSQEEAQLLQLRASSPDGATLGATTLLDPFALGTAGSLVPVRDVTPPAKDAAHHPRHHAHRHAVHRGTVSVHDLPTDTAKAHPQSGFSAQVRHSARGLRAHHATSHRHAATVVPRNGAATDDHRK